MKINTLIITILKIKIEDSALIVLIFKCIQYIDQLNLVFPLTSSGCEKMFCMKILISKALLSFGGVI